MTPQDATAAALPQVLRSFPDADQQPPSLLSRPPRRARHVPALGGVSDAATAATTASGALVACGSHVFAAAGRKGDVLVVDPARPHGPHRVVGRHGAHVTALAVCGGVLLSAGCDGLLVGRAVSGSEDLVAVVGGHSGGITAVLVAPDGRLVSAGHDGQVLAWRPGGGDVVATHPGGVEAVAVLGSGAVVTAGRDGRLLHRHPCGGDVVELRSRRRELTLAMASVGAGSLVTATGQRGVVGLWDDLGDSGWPEELGVHGTWVLALVALDADRVAAVGGDHVTVWDLASDSGARIPLPAGVHATSATVLPNGELVVAGTDAAVEVLPASRLAA